MRLIFRYPTMRKKKRRFTQDGQRADQTAVSDVRIFPSQAGPQTNHWSASLKVNQDFCWLLLLSRVPPFTGHCTVVPCSTQRLFPPVGHAVVLFALRSCHSRCGLAPLVVDRGPCPRKRQASGSSNLSKQLIILNWGNWTDRRTADTVGVSLRLSRLPSEA